MTPSKTNSEIDIVVQAIWDSVGKEIRASVESLSTSKDKVILEREETIEILNKEIKRLMTPPSYGGAMKP